MADLGSCRAEHKPWSNVLQWANYGRYEYLEEDMQHLIKATVVIAVLTEWKVTQHTNERQDKPNLNLQRKQKDRE